eukprot:1783307-Prymnesium_polylepis.1
MFRRIGPWTALRNIAASGPLIVGVCSLASWLSSGGAALYTPHGAGIWLTVLVQSCWLSVAIASIARWRPRACVLVHTIASVLYGPHLFANWRNGDVESAEADTPP